MRSSFAKSIYVGAAVLGLAGLSAVTTTTASAKSYATAGSYTALTKVQNVLVNGTNAIYSKPGTVKGAKVVASKKTVAKLATSKKSNDTFYAYGTKTTNRGSVYYKIVTMDKKYRGYIYGGKTAGTFAGGIKTTDTLTTAATPARTAGYYLKDVSKNTLWTAPKNTDINAKKVNLYGAAKTDPFTVDKAATKTKEGSLYYHVTDSKDSSISGWIYAGKGYDTTITDNSKQDLGGLALTVSADTATADNSVKIVYRDVNNNNAQVVTLPWINAPKSGAATTKAGDPVGADLVDVSGTKLADFVTNNVPANYKASNIGNATNGVKFGNTIYVDVTEAATSKVSFVVDTLAGAAKAQAADKAAVHAQNVAKVAAAKAKATAHDLNIAKVAAAKAKGTAKAKAKATAHALNVAKIADKAKTDAAKAQAAAAKAMTQPVTVTNALQVGSALTSKDLTATLTPDAKTALTGEKGVPFNATELNAVVNGIAVDKGTQNFYASNGDAYHYEFSITDKSKFASDNRFAFPGDTLKVGVTAKLVKGAATTAPADNSWIA
ncbi:S-layer protein [Levilactobacillus zymae]|uniref:S-layer protein n=1 Tax=Levilactobacillus zymae TaxID=267363 RepID=UPI003FCE996E